MNMSSTSIAKSNSSLGQWLQKEKNNFTYTDQKASYDFVKAINPGPILQAINQLENQSRSLQPGTSESIMLQSNIAALDELKSAQDAVAKYEQRLPGNDPVMSSLRVMGVALTNLEPETPEADSIISQMRQTADQRPGLRPVVEKLLVENSVTSLDNVMGALRTVSLNLSPGSPTNQGIQGRINVISQMRDAVAQYSQQPNATLEGARALAKQMGPMLQSQIDMVNSSSNPGNSPFGMNQNA